MEQYISKSAVVAEIEKLKGQLLRGACSSQISMQTYCKEEAYDEVISFLDTLEVKDSGTIWHSFDEVLPPQSSDICVYWDRDEIITTGIWEESEKPKYASKWAYTSDLLNK